MVSMGIYDTIIGCINSLFKDFKRCVKMLWPYALGIRLGCPPILRMRPMRAHACFAKAQNPPRRFRAAQTSGGNRRPFCVGSRIKKHNR